MTVLTRANSIVESEIGEDLLLFNRAEQRFHALNISGKLIWKNLINEIAFVSRDIDRCAEALRVTFGLSSKDEVSGDVEAFIQELRNAGLLVQCHRQPCDSSEQENAVNTSALKQRAYPKPVIQEIPLDWLKRKHPSALIKVTFSDTWSPASDDLLS
jgi:hypothetical protein